MECKDCKYYEFAQSAGIADTEDYEECGWCRFYPPRYVEEDDVPGYSSAIMRWPRVNHDDWCRKFKKNGDKDEL